MPPVFRFQFLDWLNKHRVFFPGQQARLCEPRTVYGIHNMMPSVWRLRDEFGALDFQPVLLSDQQNLDLRRTRPDLSWNTFMRHLEFISVLATERAADQDPKLDVVRALNCGIEVHHSQHPPTYRGPEHHRAEFRALLEDLFMSHPRLLFPAIKMCQLGLCKAHHDAYLDEFASERASQQRRGRILAPGSSEPQECPPALRDEPCLQFLIVQLEAATANPPEMHIDSVEACASHGRYTEAIMYITSQPQSSLVEFSDRPNVCVETQPDLGIFVPCNVQHQQTILNTTWAIHMETLNMRDNIIDHWYFEPLTFTLNELLAIRTHVARSLHRARQNVRPLHIPAAPLFEFGKELGSALQNPYCLD